MNSLYLFGYVPFFLSDFLLSLSPVFSFRLCVCVCVCDILKLNLIVKRRCCGTGNSSPLSVRAFNFIKSANQTAQIHNSFIRRPIQFRRVLSSVRATSDEESAARAAAANADSGAPTIFDKIISKEIPSTIVYEDEAVLAFRDISPQAPVHVLVIPKLRDGLTELGKAEKRHEEVLGRLLYAAKIVAEKEGISDGFRVVINSGASACQSVYHLHLHVLGGRQMKWPPG